MTFKDSLSEEQIQKIKCFGVDKILSLDADDICWNPKSLSIRKGFSDQKIVCCNEFLSFSEFKPPFIDFDNVFLFIPENKVQDFKEDSFQSLFNFKDNRVFNFQYCYIRKNILQKFIVLIAKDNYKVTFKNISSFIKYKCIRCGFKNLKSLDRCPCCADYVNDSRYLGNLIIDLLKDGYGYNIVNVEEVLNDPLLKARSMAEISIRDRFFENPIVQKHEHRHPVLEYFKNNYDKLIKHYCEQYNEYLQLIEKNDSPKCIKEIVVKNLFGYHSYSIKFDSKNKINILFGTNGFGKTSIFKLLKSLLIDDSNYYDSFKELVKIPYDKFVVTFFDDSQVSIIKNSVSLNFEYEHEGHRKFYDHMCSNLSIPLDNSKEDISVKMKIHYEKIRHINRKINCENGFLFVKVNRIIDPEELKAFLLKSKDTISNNDKFNKNSMIHLTQSFYSMMHPQFVRDFREKYFNLLSLVKRTYKNLNGFCSLQQSTINTFNFIKSFEPFRTSLDSIKLFDNPPEDLLVDNSIFFMEAIEEFGSFLEKFLLFKKTFENLYYEHDPSIKKVIIKDFKLSIKAKKTFDDEKFQTTLEFDQLSSGEINMANILYYIIMNSTTDSIVLIDEPEVSLHIAWQQQFTDLLDSLITDKTNMQVIIASHSPFITSGREDLIVQPCLNLNDNE